MDLKSFLKENNGFPENQKVSVSPCFTEKLGVYTYTAAEEEKNPQLEFDCF